ncbi:MAG: hypothetical protein KKD18_01830 [Nanoarchaeota archaeon]|nr:hypothetical protein [Nanoarchaeota archaeon]MBU0977132.1 hypothetical protein [Nanoarchaeota archaeon]
MFLFFNKFGAVYTKKDLWLVGGIWVLMTIVFEFIFGHYVMHEGTSVLYADYNIFNGRLWLLVLFFIFVGPRLVARN